VVTVDSPYLFLTNSMMNKSVLIVAALLTLIGSVQASTLYSYSFDSLRRNDAYYPLGFVNNGTTVMLNFSTPGTVVDFSGNFNWAVLTDTLATPTLLTCNTVTGCAAGDNFCTVECPVDSSDFYRVRVRKNDHPALDDATLPATLQFYYMTVSQFDTNSGGYSNSSAQITTRYKATEVYRRRLTKLVYN
jgi:hypothetical protein